MAASRNLCGPIQHGRQPQSLWAHPTWPPAAIFVGPSNMAASRNLCGPIQNGRQPQSLLAHPASRIPGKMPSNTCRKHFEAISIQHDEAILF